MVVIIEQGRLSGKGPWSSKNYTPKNTRQTMLKIVFKSMTAWPIKKFRHPLLLREANINLNSLLNRMFHSLRITMIPSSAKNKTDETWPLGFVQFL